LKSFQRRTVARCRQIFLIVSYRRFDLPRVHCLQITTGVNTMFMALNPWSERQTTPTMAQTDEHFDRVFEDHPSRDRPSETYGAWQATAIFELKPFSAPPGR
jgi:hypothetical protein